MHSYRSVLIVGLKYYANEPEKLGKTFLRLVSINSVLFTYERRARIYDNNFSHLNVIKGKGL